MLKIPLMPNPILKARRLLACALICLAVAGCETMQPLTPSPDFVDDTVIVSDFAQFFRLGPQQAGGADLSLRTGERVMIPEKRVPHFKPGKALREQVDARTAELLAQTGTLATIDPPRRG